MPMSSIQDRVDQTDKREILDFKEPDDRVG